MNNKRYILSPCGTSLLTNVEDSKKLRKLVFEHANAKNKNDVPDEDKDKLEKLIRNVSDRIEVAEYQQAKRMSAELNGIIQIYDGGSISENHDFHFLLSTDTWLGEETAKLVERWLKIQNPNMAIEIHRQCDLQTKNLNTFQSSLSDLVKKLYEELPGYSQKGYRIIFNLTGGFKCVQGFLQSIANFLADETVYIFEESSELMRIPKLPIKMDAADVVEKHISYFRNVPIDSAYPVPDTLPEIFFLKLDGETSLSPWGDLVWRETKSQIYTKSLLPSPRPEKIQYGEKFKKDAESLPPDRRENINNQIDELNQYLFDNKKNLSSLDFKPLKGKSMHPSTHEMNAWSDLDAKRIYGHFEGRGNCFVLDKLDKGLH